MYRRGLERLILFIYPTLAVLLNAMIFKQHINNHQKLAMVLTYVGIGIAFWGEMKIDSSSPNFSWGAFFVFYVQSHLQFTWLAVVK